jgi:hypothetical protein
MAGSRYRVGRGSALFMERMLAVPDPARKGLARTAWWRACRGWEGATIRRLSQKDYFVDKRRTAREQLTCSRTSMSDCLDAGEYRGARPATRWISWSCYQTFKVQGRPARYSRNINMGIDGSGTYRAQLVALRGCAGGRRTVLRTGERKFPVQQSRNSRQSPRNRLPVMIFVLNNGGYAILSIDAGDASRRPSRRSRRAIGVSEPEPFARSPRRTACAMRSSGDQQGNRALGGALCARRRWDAVLCGSERRVRVRVGRLGSAVRAARRTRTWNRARPLERTCFRSFRPRRSRGTCSCFADEEATPRTAGLPACA